MNNAKGPRSLICFLCGNSFGTKSLAFHIKACYKLRPSNKDRSGDVSLEPPTLYFDVISKKNLSWQEINDYNSQAYGVFIKGNLVTCKYCKNFYYPSNIKSHEIDCYKEVLLREEEEEKVREKLKRAEKVRNQIMEKRNRMNQQKEFEKMLVNGLNEQYKKQISIKVSSKKRINSGFKLEQLQDMKMKSTLEGFCLVNNNNYKEGEASKPNKWIQRKQLGSKDQILTPQITKKGSNKWEDRKQMKSTNNAQNIIIPSQEEIEKKTEEFFYDKIGHVLLENFKRNMIECRHCGRRFNEYAASKHIPICAKSAPLPPKKKKNYKEEVSNNRKGLVKDRQKK